MKINSQTLYVFFKWLNTVIVIYKNMDCQKHDFHWSLTLKLLVKCIVNFNIGKTLEVTFPCAHSSKILRPVYNFLPTLKFFLLQFGAKNLVVMNLLIQSILKTEQSLAPCWPLHTQKSLPKLSKLRFDVWSFFKCFSNQTTWYLMFHCLTFLNFWPYLLT